MKKRVRVNRAIALVQHKHTVKAQVVRLNEPTPDGAVRLIKLGMLYEGKRAGEIITGVVSAIQSTGRLTLNVPQLTSAYVVQWRKVVVYPRVHSRIRSTDSVLFLVPEQTAT